MMSKRVTALALACILLALLAPSALADKDANTGVKNYVVFYDDQTQQASLMLDLLREIMTYSAWKCSFIDIWDAALWDGDFDAAVVCTGMEQSLPADFVEMINSTDVPVFLLGGGLEQLTDEAVWRSGEVVLRCENQSGEVSDILLNIEGLWLLRGDRGKSLGGQVYINNDVYPLCQTVDNITHFAYYDAQEPLLNALLASCLQLWQWPFKDAPTAYGQYLVIDNVYPFLDPEDMMERVEMLEEERVPYILAVTPVFNNGEYPSMKRFCEFLRYAQSRGAGIIMRVPFVSIEEVDVEDLIKHMSLAYEAYALYGVYPLAIEAPKTWLQCEDGLEALRGFRTVFTFETDEKLQGPPVTENVSYKDGHQIVAPAWQDEQAFSSSYAQAMYYDAQMDLDQLTQQVHRIKHSKRVLKDLHETSNQVYCGDYAVVNINESIQVNGEYADLRYVPFEYDKNYTYDRGITQYFKEQIETSNRYMMVFVAVISVTFVGMILLFRRQIRRELVLGKRRKRRERTEEEVDRE